MTVRVDPSSEAVKDGISTGYAPSLVIQLCVHFALLQRPLLSGVAVEMLVSRGFGHGDTSRFQQIRAAKTGVRVRKGEAGLVWQRICCLFDRMGEFSQYVAELGRPYLWVQWLCGMQVLSVCDDQPTGTPQLSLSEIHMEGTIKRLRQRMKHRLSLHRQLSSLGLSLGVFGLLGD